MSTDAAKQVEGTCEDHRLRDAGYIVCGSNNDRDWHWQKNRGRWHDGFRSEYAAVNDALRDLAGPLTTKQHVGESR